MLQINKHTILPILILTMLSVSSGAVAAVHRSFSSFDRAKRHPLSSDRPAVDFFEGAILGNGALGVIVTTRPDAVVLYFGHNNVWDIRIAEKNRAKIGTFKEVFDRVKAIPSTLSLLTQDPWYNEYSRMTQENYRKPYPRPFPCGSVLLGFDRRKAEMIGHRLDISNGLCEVQLLTREGKYITLQIFVDMAKDLLWMRLVDRQGQACENIFDRVRVIVDPSTPSEFPKAKLEEALAQGVISFRQTLPYAEPEAYNAAQGHPKDKAFRLVAALNGALEKRSRINWDGNEQSMAPLEAGIPNRSGFLACVALQEGLQGQVPADAPATGPPTDQQFTAAQRQSESTWQEYWNKSGVVLSDQFLERMWYRNLYFLNCATRDGATTPGLFANWSYNTIGTAWHGDYHMNYNTQQPFWVTFSSNHLEKNLPYVNLIEALMPVSVRWAKEYYELPGAYFPHSAYPVDMSMNPYPVPTWGWEICETPWAVQGLWWHYLYSRDTQFLTSRAFGPIKAAVEFLVAYMKRPEASGPQWKDDKFHIFPTVPPELYGLRPGFRFNYDCNVDLALTKFIFKAFLSATEVLNKSAEEKGLREDVATILSRFPEYPTAVSREYGKVLVSVPGEHAQVVYNTPNPLSSVFPGEDHGIHSDRDTAEMLRSTYRNQQNEGGNDLVFMNLQAVRIGMLDLERFKRQVNYSLMPNGAASDRVMQVHGRYSDSTHYGYMDKMGIWFENFALPVVVNECLMQSYNGIIRFFPNWPMEADAEFHTLRAAGAFLVSARLAGGKVQEIRITSEAGSLLKMTLPWRAGGTVTSAAGKRAITSADIEMRTGRGETLVFRP